MSVVRPIARVRTLTRKVRKRKMMPTELIPRLMGKLNQIEIMATAGMVRPILARAEPSDKFKLLCN